MTERQGFDPVPGPVFRPRRRIVYRAIIAALALLVPLFLVVFWLSIPSRNWPFVLEIQCGLTALGVIFALGASKMFLRVTPDGLTVFRLLGRQTHVAKADIGSLALVELYQSGTVDCLPHLYLLDSAGEVLVRLSGHVWSRSTLEGVIDELGLAVLRPTEPFTMAELGRLQPQMVGLVARHTARLND